MSQFYVGGDVQVAIFWLPATATVDDVVWGIEFKRLGNGLNITDAFHTQQLFSASSATGAVGTIKRAVITLTQAQVDAIANGEPFDCRVERVTGDAGDDMIGDAQILRVVGFC